MVLIVESDLTLNERLKTAIRGLGQEVVSVTDGLEALKRLRDASPDLLLVDQSAAWIDGFRVCRLVKFHAKRRRIPVFIVTMTADDESRRLAQSVGADAYLDVKDLPSLVQQAQQALAPGASHG